MKKKAVARIAGRNSYRNNEYMELICGLEKRVI